MKVGNDNTPEVEDCEDTNCEKWSGWSEVGCTVIKCIKEVEDEG